MVSIDYQRVGADNSNYKIDIYRKEGSLDTETMYFGGYYDWLCEIINVKENLYDILIHELYSIDFLWKLPLDSDRNYDGLILRDEYYSYQSEPNDNKRCSVLEVLIALSRKMDYILDDDDRGDRTRIWFWEMIDNLDLMKFTDDRICDMFGSGWATTNEIHKIIDIWMNRNFEYNGKGSPFPLDNPLEDQRNLDLIRQLNAYILEKHMYKDELL